MLYYILQIIACQVLFLLVYDLFLKKETFFNYNRVYLLITALLSFVLPFIKIDALKTLAPSNFKINLPEVVIGNFNQNLTLNKGFIAQLGNNGGISIWSYILIFGMFVMTIVFSYKLIKIANLKLKNPQHWLDNILIVKVLKSNTAFSFFNTIFLGDKISEQQQDAILKHELVHVKHYHTIDLLVFEIMRILLWFNPLIYMYQNRIKALHEYIADETVVKQNDRKDYYKQLLNQVFETNNVSFTNSFFNKSLIKKRIIMLQKSKSQKVNVLKYALLIPMVFGMLFYVSCAAQEITSKELVSQINLDQYSYERPMGKSLTPELEMKHKRYGVFLGSNKNYVSWADIDSIQQVTIYSIHKKTEKVPDNYNEGTVTHADGNSYLEYSIFSFDNYGKTKGSKRLTHQDFNGKPEVPFSMIDKTPTFESCQNITSQEKQKKCVSQVVSKFVNINFNTDLAETLDLSAGVHKIHTSFKINKQGDIIDIQTLGSHSDMQNEAKRVIGKLPKFIAGEHDGKKVVVAYSLPISFQIHP